MRSGPCTRADSLKGPNVNGVDNTLPENCYVDQVAYVVRHGSRYPDGGAYAQWVALHEKVRDGQRHAARL